MQNNPLLNNIAFDIVKDKAIQDKTKEYIEEQKQQESDKDPMKNQNEMPNLDEVDSEEEKIIRKEIEKRKGQMELNQAKIKRKIDSKYGQYREIIETEFLDTMLKHKQVVCHFYHAEFERCKIMDKHLKIVAEQHPETLFVRIDAEKTPFFTTKLAIKILPTIVLFNDGKGYDRIIGFEDLGIDDNFPTINLTRRLVKAKIIQGKNKSERGEISIKKVVNDLEDDDDVDY